MQRLGVLGSIGKSVAKAAAKPQPAPAPEPAAVVPVVEPVVVAEPFLSVSEFAPPVTQSTSLVEQEATEDLGESLCASHLAPEPTTSSHTEASSE